MMSAARESHRLRARITAWYCDTLTVFFCPAIVHWTAWLECARTVVSSCSDLGCRPGAARRGN